MKTKLLILYHVFTYLTLGVFSLLFSGSVVSSELFLYVAPTIILLSLSLSFVTLSFVVQRVLYRKNLLKISGLFISVLFLFSLLTRIREIIAGELIISGIFLTLLYIILLTIIYKNLQELYKFVKTKF